MESAGAPALRFAAAAPASRPHELMAHGRLRIMHISTRLILGGSQENTILSAQGQSDRGHTVSLVYGPIYGPEGSMLDRVRAHRGIETIEAPRLVRQIAPYTDLRCSRDLKALIRAWRPDVVHTHSSKAGILGRLAAWRLRVPCVVHTIHGLPFHPYQPRLLHALYVAAERIAARRCHRIIVVADAMRRAALAQRVGRPEQYVTVYSGIQVQQFLEPRWRREQVRGELGLAPGDFVVGTVARLAELKGHDDLLEALGPLMDRFPQLKLLWVGDGWWRERLLKRVADMGRSDRLLHTGLLDPQEIPRYLLACDVLAHPSCREGLPRAVPQALLSGVPVVVYDVDGAREACADGDAGLLVRPGDLPALRDAVLWVMEHPAEGAAMAQRGRAFCRERFDAMAMVEHLESVYASVLEPASGACVVR